MSAQLTPREFEQLSRECSGPVIKADDEIVKDKMFRKSLDAILSEVKLLHPSRERSLAITKLQECIMWLGMDLKRLNDGRTCYQESYNPENTIVEPVADGLKL